VQLGRYASVTRIESKQSITNQNNQETYEKTISPSSEQLIVSAIQELQHVMKEYIEKVGAIFNSLAMLVTRIM